jgi:hypothetical protein
MKVRLESTEGDLKALIIEHDRQKTQANEKLKHLTAMFSI